MHAECRISWVEDVLFLSSKNIADAKVDYHNMGLEVFEEWFTTKLFPKLQKNRGVVLDNASYYSVQLRKIPSSY